MSQQLDRAGVRPADSPALLTYTGTVIEIGPPEPGRTGKNRPRKIVIKDDPSKQYGKTFRIWEWREEDFARLQPGAYVTVHYEVEPNSDPTRNGSNMISVVKTAEAGGGGQDTEGGRVWGSAPPLSQSPTPEPDWSAPTSEWQQAKAQVSKDDYWAHREATDQERTLEIESAWAIKAVLDIEGFKAQDLGRQEVQDLIVSSALQLVILKRQTASELGRG